MVTCTCVFYGDMYVCILWWIGWLEERGGVFVALSCVCVCVCARRLDGVDGDGLGAVSLWDADSGERCR